MRFNSKILGMLACTLLAAGCATKVQQSEVKPDDSKLLYHGRFTDDYKSCWTGTGAEIRFKGTAINAKFTAAPKKGVNYQVVVDGKPTTQIIVKKGTVVYPLADNLSSGVHDVQLFRNSEMYFGNVTFGGFEFPNGGEVIKVKPAERKMLVIGDSITCGYGNSPQGKDRGNTIHNEIGYLSYAPVAARLLNADIMMVCFSGKGMIRNYGMKDKKCMPAFFNQILKRKKIQWDHQKFIPDVIVINLGTNDNNNRGGKRPKLDKTKFMGKYKKFVKKLIKLYPKAKIIVAYGSMGTQPVGSWITEYAKTDNKVDSIVFEPVKGKEMWGVHGHPAVPQDKLMGEKLAEKIKAVTGWK